MNTAIEKDDPMHPSEPAASEAVNANSSVRRLQRAQLYLTELLSDIESNDLTRDIIVEKVKGVVKELRGESSRQN